MYAKNPHEGLNKQTPWAVANAWTQSIRRIQDEHALDGLMTSIAGVRVVGKKGIRHDRRMFIDPTGMLYMHVGRPVTLRYDEQDIGRLAVYRDGQFVCWAVDPETAKAIKKKQKAMVTEQANEMKAYSKDLKGNMAQVVLDHRKAESEKVHSLPQQSVPYSTPALEGDQKISLSGFNRYATTMESVGAKLRETREIANVWMARFGDNQGSDVLQLVVEMMQSAVFKVALKAGDGDEDALFNPKMLKDVSLAVQRLSKAAETNSKREQAIRKEMALLTQWAYIVKLHKQLTSAMASYSFLKLLFVTRWRSRFNTCF